MVRKESDLTDLEKLTLVDMSYSRINTYDMCALKYFYSYVLKEPQHFGSAAALGNILHEVLEIHVGEDIKISTLLKTYPEVRPKYDPDNQIPDSLIQDGIAMLQEFADTHGADDFNVLGKETYFEFVAGNALLRGYIDRVDTVDEKTLHIIDYKSGKYKITKKSVPENLQLGIYVLAMADLYPDIQTFKAELYYLRDGDRRAHTFERDDLPIIEERVVATIQRLLQDVYHHPTPNERICSFCDHAASGACMIGVRRNEKWARRR